MEWKRGCSLVLAVVLMLNAVQWPEMKGWAAEPDREAGTVAGMPAARATQSEAEQAAGENEAERERPGWGETAGGERPGGGTVGGETAGGEAFGGERPRNGTPGEAEWCAPDMEAEGISRFFVRNHWANTGGKLEVDGESVWYLNYIKDSPDKSYAYEVLDQSGEKVDQTWWNYWWDEELGGWRIQAKPTQYSLDHEEYRYFILDEEGALTTEVPAIIDRKPVVSMDGCFSAWAMPLRSPGTIPNTVVSANHCYENSEITAMPELPEGLRSMEYMFAGCSELEETARIPRSVENIDYGFSGSGIRETPEFAQGSRIRKLQFTFRDCIWLERLGSLPEQAQNLEGTFWGALAAGADLGEAELPDSVTEMEDTFFDSNLAVSPRLPEAVKTIDRCFMRCTGLVQVPLLPDSIESANQAFDHCTGLRFGDGENVSVAAPKSLANADRMFAGAYRTAGSPDAYGRDSELLYLWDESQWEIIYQNAFDQEPGEESRDAYGDYNLFREPIGLSAMELVTTGPYIDSELVLEGGKRAQAVTFRGILGRYKAPPDYYPEDVIQYRIGGAGEFQDWDGNPVYLYEDALVEARKIRSIRTYNGTETIVTDVREKTVRVQQPDVPVLDWNYMGGGEYDVTVMYRPWLRSLERVELNYRIDGGPWKSIENFGHLRAHCGQTVSAVADWGAVSDAALLRLPDYVKRIEVENPVDYTGIHECIPIVCRLSEADAGDKTYQVEITGDPDGIARVWQEEGGNWSIGNSGYGQVTIRVTANDKGGAAAEHTFSFVSPVQSVSVALETHPDGILGIGETDRALVSIIPADREGYQLSVSDATVLWLDDRKGTVTGLQQGTAVLEARSIVDPSAAGQISVQVRGDPGWIKLEPENTELYSGETLHVTCNWGPPGTAEPEVVQEGIPVDWRIVEQGVGLIRGEVRLREEGEWGTTKLTLRAKSNHEVRGQCTITWKPYVRSIKLTGPEQMAAGSQAKTQVVKDVESDEALRYTSSAPDILEVSKDGELTAKKAGEAVITVTAGYGGASGSISVRVLEPEEKDIFNIRLTLDRDVLREGEVCGYQVLVEPEYTSGTWSVTSSDPGVLEVLDGGKIKAVAPGTAKVTARETVDPDGKDPAEDERNVTVIPNQTAVLEVYPAGPLWERNGEPVIYKNLPGGREVEFACRILTDAADQSVRWSVDRADLAEIDENGVLRPLGNGMVVVTAASCAYPQAAAGYPVEIRTVATEIRYRAVERNWGQYVLTASVWPEDASPDRIYCRDQSAGEAFHDITGREYMLERIEHLLEFSTCTGQPTVEDVSRRTGIFQSQEVERRYELHSFHAEELYTVYTSDLDDQNGFSLRIYDKERGRYLKSGERSGISWPAVFERCGGYGEEEQLPIWVSDEADGLLQLRAQAEDQLNSLSGTFTDIHFLSSGPRWAVEGGELSRKEYRICSDWPLPETVNLRCLDRAGNERYRYDLSLYEGGIPEFHCGGGDQIFYTAANSEQGEVYLDINGETFPSLEACEKRYDILIYCGEENVTGRMLKQVDGQGRPQVLLMDQGVFTIIVSGAKTGAAAVRQVTAENAGSFYNLFLECPAAEFQPVDQICTLQQFRGSRSIYTYKAPFSRESDPATVRYGVQYGNAVRLDDVPGYELTYELKTDPDGGLRAEYSDHAVTARGYTSDTQTAPPSENIRVTVKREGETVAVLYGRYQVQWQLPTLELPKEWYLAVGRECRIPLYYQSQYRNERGIVELRDIEEGTVKLTLDGRPVTGTGECGDFVITGLRDGELGLICQREPAGEVELRVYVDGEQIFQNTGDPSYRGEQPVEAACRLHVLGKARGEVENVVLDVGETASLVIHCGLGDEASEGEIIAYKVLNAPAGSQPVRINHTRIMALEAGEWLMHATVRFYNLAYYDVVCQFRVTARNPAQELTVAERNGRTGCAVGEKLYLVPGYSPADAGNVLGYAWEMKGDAQGAQVDQNGTVTAEAAGDYTVVLRDLPERSLSAEYSFHVEEAQVKAEAVEVSPASAQAGGGENVQFTALVRPEEAGDREVVWEVEADGRACSISRSGVFQGMRTGDYTVRCSLAEDPAVCGTAVVHVEVRPERLEILGPSCATEGCPAQLWTVVFPSDAVYQGITWELIESGDLAEISGNGLLTCKEGIGKARVRAVIDGTDISAERELALGRELPELRAEIRGADGAVKREIQGSGDPAYLYVNGNRATGSYLEQNHCVLLVKPDAGGLKIDGAGCVHGLLAGDYSVEVSREVEGFAVRDTVQVTVMDGNYYQFLEIWPEQDAYQITEQAGNVRLRYRLVPQLREEDEIVWSVESGRDIAEINSDGLLTATGTADGLVTVKCAVLDRESGREYISQNCTILVSGQVIGVSEIHISCAGEVMEGERLPVEVTVLPENAGNKEYQMLVSNPEAGAFRDGWFYARRPGKLTLTVISEDNRACEDTAEVIVKKKEETVPDGDGGSGETDGNGGSEADRSDKTSAGGNGGASRGSSAEVFTFWRLRDGKWYYYRADGTMAADSWVLYRDQWYRLGADGVMLNNSWFRDGEKQYYLSDNGAMIRGCWGHVDGQWRYFDQNGQSLPDVEARDGFRLSGRDLVYVGPDADSWVNVGIYTYCLDERRRVMTGCWVDRGGERYYAGAGGWILRNQWNEVDGNWYFLDGEGRMVRESIVWEGKRYQLDENGIARDTGR
ncbi:hypothetical protein DWX10_10625 [Clostridium sp. AF18-27]|uniref:Ig-like domain-containing protein n=1 Tax=Enterocloster lavalensis TaxID=460384 RepID=UPI000E493EE9|nr:Ig-like domain-containing protein [Enterocloster lavalensis]RHR54317.1 hypothetical protein DWX10_10625 [Clostridium sp. AF18-27]